MDIRGSHMLGWGDWRGENGGHFVPALEPWGDLLGVSPQGMWVVTPPF
jgi:hypothetical protein